MKKRAFTLTELLVVVVIVGVLSAVVLPKFTKVLQTRKTTEAENVMAAVRNEQEARCMVGRNYTADTTKLASLPKATSKNYTYSLDAQGITATAKDGNYTLQIPSYTDGRICCSGAGCDGLNKDYPKCGAIPNLETATCEAPELTEIPDDPEPCNLSDYTRTCQQEGYGAGYTGSVTYKVNADCTGYKKTDTCTKPSDPDPECIPGEKKNTSCTCGVEKGKVCNAQGTGWEDYNNGTCALTQAEKNDCRCDEHQEVEKDCPDGLTGKQTRTETCNTATGKYEYGTWDTSACEASTKQCTGEDTQRCGCALKGTQTRTCDTSTGEWSAWSECSVAPTPSKKTEEESCTFTTTYSYSSQSDNPGGSVTTGLPLTGKRTRAFDTSTCTWGNWSKCVANAYVSLGSFTRPNNKHYCQQGDRSHCAGGFQGLNAPCNWPQSGSLSGPYCPSTFGDGCYIYQCQQLTEP